MICVNSIPSQEFLKRNGTTAVTKYDTSIYEMCSILNHILMDLAKNEKKRSLGLNRLETDLSGMCAITAVVLAKVIKKTQNKEVIMNINKDDMFYHAYLTVDKISYDVSARQFATTKTNPSDNIDFPQILICNVKGRKVLPYYKKTSMSVSMNEVHKLKKEFKEWPEWQNPYVNAETINYLVRTVVNHYNKSKISS